MEFGMCGKNLMWRLEDNGTLTIRGTGNMENYSGKQKAPYYDERYISQPSIKKVIIEYGATSIGGCAFEGCESLTSVTIPNSVTTIGSWAFGLCENLKEIRLPDSITFIGEGTFLNCKSLTAIKIPNGVTKISVYSFGLCESLKEIMLPDSITFIGEKAFSFCKSLKEIMLSDSITFIGDYAFCGCSSFKTITIPNSVTSIGKGIFLGCDSLERIYCKRGTSFKSKLRDGNNAKLIPYNVTPPVTKPTVQTVTRPKPTAQPVTQPKPTAQPVAEKLTWSFAGKTLTVGGVREIKFFPYGQIPWLKHLHDIQRIVVGDGVEKIAAQAFEECKRLELVTLPASVKTIGDMFASVSFCGDRFVNGGRNVFWCLEDGVLVLKKNPAAVGDDFSTGFASWIFADKNIRGVKLEPGIKPTENFFAWLSSHDGAAISFG